MSLNYFIAYSGGLDSHVLLHFLHTQFPDYPLQAIHIDHQLFPESKQWAQHCQQVCRKLSIPLKIIKVNIKRKKGESLEAAARVARYQAIATLMKKNDLLFTAHHLDDQAETFMLQLLRGAGLKGVSSMPSVMPFHNGYLVRPLLKFSREELLRYASAYGLQWIDDISNKDTRFDRNFLRQEIFPVLKTRWPQIAKTMARFAAHCAEQEKLVEDLVGARCVVPLLVSSLIKLEAIAQQTLLRQWIKTQGFKAPPRHILEQIQKDVLTSRQDATPKVCWSSICLRRYRDELFIFTEKARTKKLTLQEKAWCEKHLPKTLKYDICFRIGGEKFRPKKSKHRRELKKLFQEWGIPPWLRDKIPLIFVDGECVAVVGYAVGEKIC